MKWSKLRSNLSELRAPTLHKRLEINRARYRFHFQEYGRIWIELDKEDIASFATMEYHRRIDDVECELQASGGTCSLGTLEEYGEFSCDYYAARAIMARHGIIDDYMASSSLFLYLSLSIDDALRSISPLHRMLAVADRRVGKRRLRRMGRYIEDHPLVSKVYLARCVAEGLDVDELMRTDDVGPAPVSTYDYFDLPR